MEGLFFTDQSPIVLPWHSDSFCNRYVKNNNIFLEKLRTAALNLYLTSEMSTTCIHLRPVTKRKDREPANWFDLATIW